MHFLIVEGLICLDFGLVFEDFLRRRDGCLGVFRECLGLIY
jgi:hypothetical protein